MTKHSIPQMALMLKMILFFVGLVLFLLGFMLFASAQPNKKNASKTQKVSIDTLKLYPYKIDKTPEQTQARTAKVYSSFPQLRPERFIRRMKMFFGIDINDYPLNAMIYIGAFRLYKDYQLFEWHDPTNDYDDDHPPYPSPKVDAGDYPMLMSWLYYNDKSAYAYFKRQTKISDKKFQKYDDNSWDDNLFLLWSGSAPFNYKDEYFDMFDYLRYHLLSATAGQKGNVHTRSSDVYRDALYFYIQKQQKKGRVLRRTQNKEVEGTINLFYDRDDYPEAGNYQPWKYSSERKEIASFFSFYLSLNDTVAYKVIIKKIYNSYSTYLIDGILSNNYYGYTLLREFMTNPKREMPTLEKIGKSVRGQVKVNTLLRLEPFEESIVFDTITPDEAFAAYEMGYDDYYSVELKKPVESPVAGADGYAMIVDQTETIRGYLKKSEVVELKGNSLATPDLLIVNRYKDSSVAKRGVINDPDGYVNVRAAGRTDARIIGKLKEGEIFKYWEIKENPNWYIIQTNNGLRGFVYQNRVQSCDSSLSFVRHNKKDSIS